MDSHHLVSPQTSAVEAAAQAQARRMQPGQHLNHGHHHHSGHGHMSGHGSEEVGGQQFFNPAAMMSAPSGTLHPQQHSRNMSIDSSGGGAHYNGMQLPPIGGSGGPSNGSHPTMGGHPSIGHQSPRLTHQSPQQHSSPAPNLFSPSPGHPYGSHFNSQGHPIPSQLSYPQHSPGPSHTQISSGQNPAMPMYAYGVHHPSPSHYAHASQGHGSGIGGMVSGAGGGNPMMGAPGGGASASEFGNHNYGHHSSHYSNYFHPPGGVHGLSGQATSGSTATNPTSAPPSTAAQPQTQSAQTGASRQNEVKKSKASSGGSKAKKSSSPDRERAKDRHHPYASEGHDEGKPAKKSKKSEDPAPKPPVLKSHLKPPKQAPSAWQIFFTEELQKIKSKSPEERLNVAHVAKAAGQRYAALPESKKEEFQRRSQEAKEQWERDMQEWKSKLTPEDIKQENMFRTAQRKAGKSRKGNLKDPNAPKKPLSAYFLFLRAIRADAKMTQEVFEGEQETTKQSVLAAAKWRSLSETEKQPYLDKAEQDKTRYEQLRREYEASYGADGASSAIHGSGGSDGEDE
ncbi:hypothetical protein IE53DRAFT_370728 [Violaceomyces palustris]|uniref:Uncharacterized protein n=1 Tax=Violaceomyces palustris TaxID=1673888 RepID=A0ACD0NR52_9BASI|nr:hypothetical protein IE53DRAFT_370728 [Violaceomyces palustris]